MTLSYNAGHYHFHQLSVISIAAGGEGGAAPLGGEERGG